MAEDKMHWVEDHLPTFLRLAQAVERAVWRIPLVPAPVATIILAGLGLFVALMILALVGIALNITVRP